MSISSTESIASRFVRLNQLLLGKSHCNLPKKYLAHRDGLLDALFALYEECSAEYLRKDKHIADFVDKYKGVMLELKSLRVNLKDFEVKKIIGRGHFGEVQVVREKASGDIYAMKVLRKLETLSQKNVAFYEEERDIMAKSNSPWITKLQYAFQDSLNLYLIMEFHPGGDMLSLLEKYDNVLPADMCQFYLAELVLAIHSVHTMGYVHRDIKPDNILIDLTGHIKLADFGSSSKLNHNKQVTSCMPVGTPDYVAPEVLVAMNPGPANKSYGIECDWWSLGIVAYEMIFGSTPFANEKLLVTYNNIMHFEKSLTFPEDSSDVSELFLKLIRELLQGASTRLGYDELIVHPLFTDIDWNNIRHNAPPYVPTVTSVDDTSNFDDFEPENRAYVGELKVVKEFSGKNLPFVGFTYTTPIETMMENSRQSSFDEYCSPSSSFSEVDSLPRKKEVTDLNLKVSQLSNQQVSMKNEIKELSNSLEAKNKDYEKIKSENAILQQLNHELDSERKQLRQLLAYEREHRVITEKKSVQLIKCMKAKHRQDSLRLKAKSQEYNKGENENCSIEEQLDIALSKIEEYVAEKVELLEDLQETRNMLLECQKKLAEHEHLFSSCNSNLDNDTSLGESEKSDNISSTSNTFPIKEDYTKLIAKLEKKNVQLEHDLESAMCAKKEAEAQCVAFKNALLQLENNEKHSEKKTLDISCYTQAFEATEVIKALEKEVESKKNTITELQTKLSNKEESFMNIKKQLQEADGNITTLNTDKQRQNNQLNLLTEEIAMLKNKYCIESCLQENQKNTSPEIPVFEIRKSQQFWEQKVLQDITDKQGQHSAPSMKQENENLKLKIGTLEKELKKLKEDYESKESSYKDFNKCLLEKENALSEVKLDLKISTRKEQQAEALVSSLRERNKDLREQIRQLEDTIMEKTKAEDVLMQQLESLKQEVLEKTELLQKKEKTFEINKAILEERVKVIQDTCETSKGINEKFAKSQGQYEELVKQNTNLTKECEEKGNTVMKLLEEVKSLRNELNQKQKECTRYEKISSVLKNTSIEMEEELKDLVVIVETRDKMISDLNAERKVLEATIKKLQDNLKQDDDNLKEEHRTKDDLMKHIEELTSEMKNQNLVHEAELQNFEDQLSFYKKMIEDLEQQNTQLKKEFSLVDKDTKSYSEKILSLESQLCEIKEEAARHITQISSLKKNNLNLTQALNDALESQNGLKKNIEELYNELEREKANHVHEKVKLQGTISQQTKLIDFLQAKAENMEKKKKPHLTRLFGKKDSTTPIQSRDVEKLLETERSRCRRLQDQLSQARAENMALQREISNISKPSASSVVEVPVSPKSRAMHSAITFSPTSKGQESPVLHSRELAGKFTKPPGMKHKIPHRFTEVLSMRSIKCCACLDSIHFGRHVAKCQDCSIVCHRACATSLPSTCGLPSGFLQHFKTVVDCPSKSDSEADVADLSEGWIKMPKANKQGWDRRYLRIKNNELYIFENAEESDPKKSLLTLDFSSSVARIAVTSAVSATELPHAASSDLLYVLKLEYFPHTTCWPQRSLYFMVSNFNEKQMWVSALENLAETNQMELENPHNNKLNGKNLLTLKGDNLIDPLCTLLLDEDIILLGATDGLYMLKIINEYTCSFKSKVKGVDCVYQMSHIKNLGILVLIEGDSRKLTYIEDDNIQTLSIKSNQELQTKPVANIENCHLFSTTNADYKGSACLCIATSKSVMIYQWDPYFKLFCAKKTVETNEPCSCILFAESSVIFGTDSFYELSLNNYLLKKFLDLKDESLTFIIYGASQFRSFPIAIFSLSSSNKPQEYLLCFHEMGVFVNGSGQRTRPDDMKWSKLPLSFAYQSPYLFIVHFHSVEVIEIPPASVSESGLHAVLKVHSPQYLGPAHLEQSIYISSNKESVVEFMLVDGRAIGQSAFDFLDTDTAAESYSPNSSSKTSIEGSDALDFSFTDSIDATLQNPSDGTSLCSKTSDEYSSARS
ncbi:citron Rho-interacting kinase-like [Uloborus diversus]|uniref:citron Rho-interacting kinase-like n=1 Tax=Uloborus diversus TaxID=327109 RepID=UPI00240A8FE2|nr:citron Rho-interacting kinase-like [Uloborus diversus]